MNITKISVTRPTLIVVIFIVLLFLGFSSYKSLKYELMPDMTAPAFNVMTFYPGASPSEVESSITKKLEDVISSVENIDHIQSTSQEGVSMVGVSLKMSADIDKSVLDAQRKINAAKHLLPNGVTDPMISKITLSEFPIINIGATASMASTDFYDLLKHTILPKLSQIEGIGEVNLIGGNEREIRVNLYPEKLRACNLSSAQVLQALQSSSLDFPTGKIINEDAQMVIRLAAKFKSIKDVENVVVNVNEYGSKVLLKDIAEVIDCEKEPTMLTRVDGVPSIGLSVRKQSDANAIEVCKRIRNELTKLETAFKTDKLSFVVPFDSSIFTKKAADSVLHDLLFAVLLVSLVMLVFLHGLRNALIVMVAIPLSIISSFLGMHLLGYTLNIMTLLAMSLVIGILVDDAIVVLENIYRHLEMGKNRIQATLDGRSEISYTAVAITLVDVVVFLPIGLSTGFISKLIGPFALVVVITTLLSLFVAFTAVPLLTSRLAQLQPLLENRIQGKFYWWFEKQIERFAGVLHALLIKAFRYRAVTIIVAALLFFGSIALIPAGFIGSEAFGLGDAGEFVLKVELPKDATLKETNLKTLEIESFLRTKPEIASVFTSVGAFSSSMQGGEHDNSNLAEIDVKLIDKKYRNVSLNVYANQIRNLLNSEVTGAKITSAVVNPFFGGTDDSPIQVIVKSSNPDSLIKYTEKIQTLIGNTSGAIDVTSSLDNVNTEIAVDIDKQKMADLGLSLTTVGSVMAIAFSGNTDMKFSDGDYEYDINVVHDQFNRRSLSDVENLTFINAANQPVQLKQFASIGYRNGYSSLERFDRNASTTVQSQVIGRSSGDVGDEIKKKINAIAFPTVVSIYYAGDMEMQNDAFGTLGFALLTAIFLVYLIMVALYESFIYPFVVLFSIPLAIVGALLALALTRNTLSVFSIVGIIMLIGLVAKNAILVVDFANQLKKKGYSTIRSLLMATRLRIRPVLMTNVSMIIGLLPIALASGPASEWKNGLAWVLIGGLTSSMLLTLIVVPVVFSITDNLKLWITKRLFKQKQTIIFQS